MAKKVANEKTLAYAVAFHFCTEYAANFRMGSKIYQHVKTVYDERADGRGTNTLEVVYDYKNQKYTVLNVSDESVGGREVVIIP